MGYVACFTRSDLLGGRTPRSAGLHMGLELWRPLRGLWGSGQCIVECGVRSAERGVNR